MLFYFTLLIVVVTSLYFLRPLFSKILTHLTNKVFQEKIVFNCVWEDPHIDKQALDLVEDESVICTITSAGCNVLSLALESPKHIYSIDRNPCQNALLELKISAIREFDYEQFWQLFGKGKLDKFSKVWYPRLRQHLSPASRQFWDKHSHYFDGNGGLLGRKSFFYRGSSGFLAWCLVKIYFRIIGVSGYFKELVNAKTLEEQKEIYKNKIEKRLWNPVLMWLVSSKTTLALLNGVPSAQQKLLEEETGEKSVVHFIKNALEEVLLTLPIKDNYFYRVYLENGEYTKDCCPDYLIKENFNRLKNERLIDRISIHTCTIEEFLIEHKKTNENEDKKNSNNNNNNAEPLKDINRYILLDHMDWMSTNPKMLASEWQQIIEHSADDSRYLYRSASKEATFVKNTEVAYQGKGTTIGQILDYHVDLAERLHKLDRVHTYTSFFIADLKN